MMLLWHRLTASLCLLLMTPGCGPGQSGVDWTAPVTVDLAGARCPDVDPRDRAEARRRTPAPKPDAIGKDGKPYITAGAWKRATAAVLDSEARKGAALARAHADIDDCRGQTTPTS